MSRVAETEKASAKERIRESLLELLEKRKLEDITVMELVREAKIGRSTFYLYYRNIAEVFDELVRDFYDSTLSYPQHMGCEACSSNASKPFCERVLADAHMKSLARTPQFIETIIGQPQLSLRQSQVDYLMSRGLSCQQAEWIYTFQTSGCYALLSMSSSTLEEWRETQELIDAFVQGGIDAICPGGHKFEEGSSS